MPLPLTEEEIVEVVELLPSWSRQWPAGSVRLVTGALLAALDRAGWRLVRRVDCPAGEARPAATAIGATGVALALGRRR